MLHQGIKKYFPLEYELALEDVPKGFDYYALGHLHMRIVDDLFEGKLVYPGSTEIWRIDELKDYEMNGKGFYVVDTEDFDLERVDLENIRPFVKREITSEDLKIGEIEEAMRGGKKPVVNLTVVSDIHDYPWVYQKLVDELKGALYLDIKRRWTAEGEEVFSDRIINIRELIDDAMNDYSAMERDYAYSLFKSLSSGDLDEALAVTEEFYKVWREEGEKEREILKLEAQKKVEKPGQSTLEVFR
jgi:DNA repair exonuclease SbcCD nuclease subunit